MNDVNRLAYSHTRSLEVWKRWAPYLCTSTFGLRVALAVGVAAEVVAPLEDEHPETQLLGAALGDGEAEQAGADDDEVGKRGS